MKLHLKRVVAATALASVLFIAGCSKKAEDAGLAPQLKPWSPSVATKHSSPESVSTVWKTVEKTDYKWNGRGRVTLVTEIPASYGDPGNFTRVRINVPGEKEFVLENPDGWMNWDDKQSSLRDVPFTKARRLPRSHAFLFVSNGRRDVLFLSSWGYASDPARLHIIELGPSGAPIVAFSNLFESRELKDLDGDGLMELAGMPCLSQAFGPDGTLTTYDPIHVLKFGANSLDKLALSVPLSKIYNEKHGFGWAGPECNENLAVFRPKHGKPQILPTEEAEKLADAELKK